MLMVTEVHNNEQCYCVRLSVPFRSAIMGYVHMLGFALSQSWSGITSTLISCVVLMLTSTTAQDRGGTFMFFFSDTDDLDGVWYSAVSAMTSLFCVNWRVLDFAMIFLCNFESKSLCQELWVFSNACTY